VDITVDQNRGPIVVGKATTIQAIQRVRHSGRRTRPPRLRSAIRESAHPAAE
jgi:hypothetical protein